MSDQSSSGTERNPAFEVSYKCENCGAEWDHRYPSRTIIYEDGQIQVHNKDCDNLGTNQCDCCHVIRCPVCELLENVSVADRNPIQGDRDA
jgi:hypothetical protein